MKTIPILILLVLVSGAAFAAEDVVYYCPKCGSEKIQWVRGPWPSKKTVVRKFLDDAAAISGEEHFDYRVRRAWAARCLDCTYNISIPPKEYRLVLGPVETDRKVFLSVYKVEKDENGDVIYWPKPEKILR